MDLEILVGEKDNLKENFINNFLETLSNFMEEKYIVDRFEEDLDVCENSLTKEMVNIPKKDLPENIQEGMTIKKSKDGFKIDTLNCSVCIKKALETLKKDWDDLESLYVVNNVLDKAVKCTSLNLSENIYIKDENLISNLKKGTIIKKAENNFLIDTEKTVELKEKLLNMKF